MKKLLFSAITILLLASTNCAWGAPLSGNYTKVTDISILSNGDKVVLYCDAESLGVTGWDGSKDATVAISGFVEYVIEKEGDKYYFKDNTRYIASPGTSNVFKYGTKSSCSVDENGVLKCNDRFLCANGLNYRMYSAYTSYKPFYVYKVSSCTDPTITTQPQGANYTQNATASALSVVASGDNLTYQWYSNTTNSNTGGTTISGATSSTYTPSTAEVGTKYYYCVVSSGTCSTTSSAAAVTVSAATTTYTVTFNYGTAGSGVESMSGGSITLPTPTVSCEGWTFEGWGTSEVAETSTKPNLLEGSTYTPASDITLYAVYKKTTGGSGSTVTHTITANNLAATNTTYKNFSYTIGEFTYKGNSAKDANDNIQLRSSSNITGILTTQSNSSVRKITVVWSSTTTSGRTLDVYGKTSEYTSADASDLYDASKQGTKLGSIVYGTSTELQIEGDYQYVGLRSNNGAMYITSITIEWGPGGSATYATSPAECSTCSDGAVVSITAPAEINIGETGTAETPVTCSQTGGGAGGVWSYTIVSKPDGATATFDGTNFSTNTAGEYVLKATYTETCEKSATTTITVTATPTINLVLTEALTGFETSCVSGSASESKSFTVSGYNLTADVTAEVASTSAFELSNDNSTWSKNVTIAKGDDGRVNQPIYVRLKSDIASCPGNATTTRTGTITVKSTGAGNEAQQVSGAIKAPSITVKLNDQGHEKNVSGQRLCCTLTEETLKGHLTNDTPCDGVQFSHFVTDPTAPETPVVFPYAFDTEAAVTFYAVYKKVQVGGVLQTSYDLVTSAADISSGNIYAIAHAYKDYDYFHKGTARAGVKSAEPLADSYETLPAGALEFEFESAGTENKYYFKSENGYLNATKTGGNSEYSLTTQTDWTVTYSSELVVQCGTNYLRGYNEEFRNYDNNTTNEGIRLFKKNTSSFTYELNPCGPAITATGDLSLTGVKGGWVRGKQDVEVSAVNLPTSFNVTVNVKVLSGPFAVRKPDTSSVGSSEYTLVTGYGGETYTGSFAVIYTPTAYSANENGQIEIRAYKTNGTEEVAKCTLDVVGHSLPETFVIAANTGSGWVALPNTMGETQQSAGANAAYAIQVDNDSDPTEATLAPTTAIYNGAGRATTYNYSAQSGVRFVAGGKYLQGSEANETKLWLSTTNAQTAQSWYLNTENFKDYEVYLSTRTNANRHIAYESTTSAMGNYVSTGTTVRFLPVVAQCTRYDAPTGLGVSPRSNSATISWDEDETLAYEYRLTTAAGTAVVDAWTDVPADGVIGGSLNVLTEYKVYLRVKVTSGENCSDVAESTFTTTNCDDAPALTDGSAVSLGMGECGTIRFLGEVIATNNADGCAITEYGFQYTQDPTWATFEVLSYTDLTQLDFFEDSVTVSRAGRWYARVYATNAVGTSVGAADSTDISGLANLELITANDATTAPMIGGKATLRIGAATNSPAEVQWTVTDAFGTPQPNIAQGLRETGLFTTRNYGVYVITATQAAVTGADPYCAATASINIEVRKPNYYAYVTNCALLNNNNIEVLEVADNEIKFGFDDADMLQIEIVKENTGVNNNTGGSQAKDLFISKYFEGAGTMKLFGIFNGTGRDASLSDYTILIGSKGKFSSPKNYDLTSLGSIKAGQEIIFFTRPESGSTLEILKDLYSCSKSFLDEKSTENSEDSNPRWIECDDVNFPKITFSGDDPIAIQKNGNYIDVFGTINGPAPVINEICGSNKKDESWVSETVYNMDYGKSTADFVDGVPDGVNLIDERIRVFTARVILFRSKNVDDHSGSVLKNVSSFVTLGEEWLGRSVCKTGNDADLTCAAYKELGLFDYAEYFNRYEPVTGKIDTSHVNMVHNADGSWSLSTNAFAGTAWAGKNFHDLACTSVKINGYKGDSITTSLNYKVPIIVDYTTDTKDDSLFNWSGMGRVICPDCDVVVRDSSTLSVVGGGYNQVRNVWVYSGAELNIDENMLYSSGRLIIESENNEVGYALIEGKLNAQYGIAHTKRIDAMAWYDFALPYDCNVADIVRTNGKTLGTYTTVMADLDNLSAPYWTIRYYDGAKRASEGTPNGATPTNWASVPANGQLKAGAGYIIGLGGSHNINPQHKLRFILPNRSTQPYVESITDKRTKDVKGYTGAAAMRMPCHQGWNYIGNLYVAQFNGKLQDPAWNTTLLLNGYYTDQLTGDTYDGVAYPDIYVAVNVGENGYTNWVQSKASEAKLSPFRAFMVQAVGDGVVDFNKAARELPSQPQSAPARTRDASENVVSTLRLTATNKYGSEFVEVMLNDRFTQAYDLGYDMSRMINSSVGTPQIYALNHAGDMLIYAAANRTEAEQTEVPLGVRCQAADEVTFALTRSQHTDCYSAIYLVDKEENDFKVDLLQSNYTISIARGDTRGRFAITFVKRAGVSTELPSDEIATPLIYRQGDDLVIDNLPWAAQVRVVDAVGRVLHTQRADAQTLSFHAPVRGAYIVQVITEQGSYSIKVIM